MLNASPTSRYVAAATDLYDEWNACQSASFQPNARQLPIIEAVQSAIDADLFYTQAVHEHCKLFLGVSLEQAAVNTGVCKVEGGDFGMDCYYARSYISAKIDHEQKAIAFKRLNPFIGQVLGTLAFNDYRRVTGMTVVEVSENMVGLVGKKGTELLRISCSAKSVENAMNRAVEKGWRKSGFEFFVNPLALFDEPSLF